MKDLFLTLPPFAPDYGGACEVMYELGGLVLIHDASGCTVNYVSFDEPRFHDRPGAVFSSGLTEIEAVMGDDDALIDKAIRAAELIRPNFIAYVGSSVPMVVGTDFAGIAAETEARCGVPAFGFDCNGIRSYTWGAGRALRALLDRFCGEKTESRGTLLLGLLPLDEADLDATRRVRALFPDLRASLCFDCTFDDLKTAQNAARTVVVSASGLPAAELLRERYGIPYTVGLPLKKSVRAHGSTLVIGEDVRSHGLAQALGNAEALDLFSPEGLAQYHTNDEEEIARIAARFDNVVADPCFAPLVRSNFVPMPTISVSGGIYRARVSALDVEGIAAQLV